MAGGADKDSSQLAVDSLQFAVRDFSLSRLQCPAAESAWEEDLAGEIAEMERLVMLEEALRGSGQGVPQLC